MNAQRNPAYLPVLTLALVLEGFGVLDGCDGWEVKL